MSWTDEEIDKLYQEKSKGLQFDYKPEYWNEMEALLPEKRKGDGLWFITSLLFLGLVSSVALFNDSKGEVQKAVYGENTLALKEVDAKVARNVTEVEKMNSSEFSSTGNRDNKEKSSTTSINNVEKERNFSVSRLNEVLVDKKIQIKTNNELVNSSEISFIAEEKNMHVGNTDNKEVLISNEHQVLSTNTDGNENPVSSEPDFEVEKLVFKGLDKVEQNSELASFTSNFKMPVQSSFYVQGIGGVSQSLVSPSDKTAYSYGIGIGAQFRKGKFVFTTGMNGIISNHQDLELNREAKVYSYGSQIIQNHLNYSQIYLIEANLLAGFQLGRHTLDVGVRPSYNLSSKVSYNSSVNEEGSRVVYGHMDGLRRFGLKPTIGYSFLLPKNFIIGLTIGTQIRPMVNEQFINGVNNTLPIDGQLYLRKKINFRR